MIKYYMHARSDGVLTFDDEVYFRSNLEFMRAEAFYSARELMSTDIRRGEAPHLKDSFDITDEGGVLLMNVVFGDTLDRSMPRLEPRESWMELSMRAAREPQVVSLN